MAVDSAPMSPETGDEQLSAGARSVTGAAASPLTPDSSPRHDSSASAAADDVRVHQLETSTPLKRDDSVADADADGRAFHSTDFTERPSTASYHGTPSNRYFPEAAAACQPYATLRTSPFLGTSMSSSPMKGVAAGLQGSGVRCPPVREAVDPAKYITINGEPDGVKYACSKCGNIYKWRKSLNKHWKEKHDGEAPDPAAVTAAASRYNVRLPTPVVSPAAAAAKRPSSSTSYSAASNSYGAGLASSSAIRPTGVRGSLAAILPTLPGQSGAGLGRGWNQSESTTLQSPQLKTPTFADYAAPSSGISASPFSVLAADSVSSRERPVDLSGSASRAEYNDDALDCGGGGGVLDLSKKGVAAYDSLSNSSSVQDEPIDFSTKSAAASRSVGIPTYESGFYRQSTFAGRPLEMAHAAGSFSAAATSLNCAQCRQKFTVPSKLNRHFADAHSDLLHVTAGEAAVGDMSHGGSTQLYQYLTTECSDSRQTVRCVVCGTVLSTKSSAAKHFDQEHVGLSPNPYQVPGGGRSGDGDRNAGSSATQKRQASGIEQQLAGAGNQLRCGRCPFTTDSFAVLARHHLRHSPRRPNDPMTTSPDVSRIMWAGAAGGGGGGTGADVDNVKVAELQLLSAAVNVDDVIGENTAIVIPQAPEETATGTLAASSASSSPSSKPFRQTSSGARSSGGRSKRSDIGGSSAASAETLLPFKCDLCEYRARWPSEMTQHAKNHSDEKPYHCPQCTYRSKWKWDVVKHLKRCGGGGTARDVIDTTSLIKSTAASSVTTTPATAAAAQTARRRRTNVRSLLIDLAPAVYPPPTSYGQQVPRGNVSQSLAQLSAATSALSSREQPSNGPPNVTACSRAQDTDADRVPADAAVQTVAETAATMTTAVQAAKTASPTPPPIVSLVNQGLHYCLQCSFVGHSPAELRRHLRVHSDEKPYSCRTCCYSSKWKCDLKKHLRAYNHVSAVPLAYGGHGRKPTSSDWQRLKDGLDVAADGGVSGPADGSDDTAADSSETRDDGTRRPDAVLSLTSNVKDGSVSTAKTERMPNGSSFAGITVGGRLRCRRCDFEAIDLTSFLQHKSTHSAVRSSEKGDTTGDQGLKAPATAIAAAATRPNHHRRKSSKQVRVPPENRTDKYVDSSAPAVSVEYSKSLQDDQVNVPDSVDDSEFWTSLGLRSKKGAGFVQSADLVGDGGSSSAMDMTVDGQQQKEQHRTATEAELATSPPPSRDGSQSPSDADVVETAETAAEVAVTPSPESSSSSSSSDTDVEYIDMDQPVDLCRRPAETPTEPAASLAAAQQKCNAVERVTTTEADDAVGMSKRKRKLRTCDKCGYVTDNLTTLQRHAAKHGSAGG